MTTLAISEAEVHSIKALAREVAALGDSVERPELLRNITVYAHELPRRLRQELNEFKLTEPTSGLCVVSGYPIDDEKIGDTPAHWKDRPARSPALEEEVVFLMLGSLLGEPIGWSTQQDGRLVHDVIPIRGHEDEQLGSGSEQLLWWHTEDAFHSYRGDYIGMLCLRNPSTVPTTIATLENIQLDPRHVDLLFEPHFTIRPDESHLRKNRGAAADPSDGLQEESYRKIEDWATAPQKIAVLFGDRSSPYLRLDPYFMDPLENREAQAALDALIHAIDAALEDLVLQPGDMAFIDNYRAVHGRKPFKARYDGGDRWLKRINLTRDLRKSRDSRAGSDTRVIS